MSEGFVWKPVLRADMESMFEDELKSCSDEERDTFTRLRIPLKAFPFKRMNLVESVFACANKDGYFLIYDDVECGFEWCKPDADGVIREHSCGQGGLQSQLADIANPP